MPDAFDVLELEPKFSLERTELDRRERELLAALHPSRASGNEDRRFARQGEINEALRQLRDPVTRAELLLRRAGQMLPSAQSPELLVRVFAQREALEQALSQRSLGAASACVDAARARRDELLSVLTAYFESGPVQACGQSAFAVVLQELKYLNKIIRRGEQGLYDLE